MPNPSIQIARSVPIALYDLGDGTFAIQTAQSVLTSGADPADSSSEPTRAAFTSTTSASVFAANAAAKRRTVVNDSDRDMFIRLDGGTVTVTDYDIHIPPGATWIEERYVGSVTGLLSGAIGSGQVRTSELV